MSELPDFLMGLAEEAERLDQQTGMNNDVLDKYVIFPKGDGAITVRLLPPAPGNKFYQWTRTHRLNQRNIHCPKQLVNGKYVGECEICKYYNWLWKQSEDPSKSESEKKTLQAKARAIKPVERYYYNCIVRSWLNPKTEQVEKNVGPKILSIGKMLHKMIVRAIVGAPEIDEPALGDVTDVAKGRDFKIVKRMVRSGNDEYPQYNESKFLDPSVTGDKQQVEQWLAGLHDLVALRVLKDADQLEHELKVYLGLVVEEKNNFDPTKFMKPEAQAAAAAAKPDLESQVRAEVARNELPAQNANATPPAAPAGNPEDDLMAEADFLNTLKNMK